MCSHLVVSSREQKKCWGSSSAHGGGYQPHVFDISGAAENMDLDLCSPSISSFHYGEGGFGVGVLPPWQEKQVKAATTVTLLTLPVKWKN